MRAAQVLRRTRSAAPVLLFLLVLLAAPSALGYPTYTGEWSCDACHATTGEGAAWDGSGPHGNYTLTTSKCKLCHSVHAAAPSSILLLRGATITQSCESCHDGTGGIGVYTTIEAQGHTVGASHACESTTVVPGGTDPLGDVLSCAHCHSAHGANTVAPFLRDSGRAFAADEYVVSDCLLRSDVNTSAAGTYPEYGAKWCAACHDQRHSDSGSVVNHPVDSDPAWGYGDVTSTVTVASWRTYDVGLGYAVGMGRTNGGYLMAPVAEDGDGRVLVRRDPMCQQCHEDSRDVEDVFSADYTHRGTDPWNTPVNPEFVTFPHQTTNVNMLVETGDDLCLNCHSVSMLP